MEKLRLLACFAHPDDEAFGTGGTLARYAAQGYEIQLVCATRGEVGEISDEQLATPATLGAVREAELRCAAETMGIAEPIFLNYRDSGMAGTAENNDPRAFVNIPPEQVVAQLVQIIRQVKPHVVVTFEPFGGYGHPDHIAIHRHTVAAFHAAADASQFPGLGESWQAERLFYTAIPRSFFVTMREKLAAMGADIDDLNAFDDPSRGWPDDQIHVVEDVTDTVQAKWGAMECHRTQFGPGNLFRRLPKEQVMELMSREYFAQAWPAPVEKLYLRGLFDGLN
jgi:N-acetyl-1-D-myo-inositol-2-amino-2-deoxy-alpha-D-glucopyranoside deacetylase